MVVNTLHKAKAASHHVCGMEQIVLVLGPIWTLVVCVENPRTKTAYHQEALHGAIMNTDAYVQVSI